MNTGFTRLLAFLPLLLLAALTPGCATPALWKHTAACDWKPKQPDRVLLITDTNEQREVALFFVQHQTQRKKALYRNVGWNVSQPPDKLAVTPKTISQFTNSCRAFQTVPLYEQAIVPDHASSQPPGYAVWNSTTGQIAVHIDGFPSGPYTLPATSRERNTALRVCAMPFAIAADGAIIAALIFVLGGAGHH